MTTDTSYSELKAITDRCYAAQRTRLSPVDLREIHKILNSRGIRFRQDDGNYFQTTVTVPPSLDDALVVGIRYRKRDGTFTEDHFLFRKGRPIERGDGKKKWLETTAPEYKGTHKLQLSDGD